MKTGIELIADERLRQVAKGYDSDNDERYTGDSLAMAALSYVTPPTLRNVVYSTTAGKWVPRTWPWAPEFWKGMRSRWSKDPEHRIRELVKAEIDRLQRKGDGS